jgi:hypothetical protein
LEPKKKKYDDFDRRFLSDWGTKDLNRKGTKVSDCSQKSTAPRVIENKAVLCKQALGALADKKS